MKVAIKTFAFVVACLSTENSLAQVLPIDTVLMLIERNNPMLKEYDNKVKALDHYAAGATGWMAPMLGAGTFMTPYTNPAIREANQGAWMFSLEQEIPNPAKLNANKRYLQSKGEVEEQNRSIVLNNLRAEAKTTYYQWLVAERKLSVLNENAKAMDLMLKLARIRYPYNQGSLGNIYKAEGRLGEIENMLTMTRGEIEETRYRLRSLISLPLSDSIRVDTATVIDFEPSRLHYDTALLADRRSDVNRIDAAIEVMRLNQKLQKFQAKPDFKVKFDHMQPIGGMPTAFSAMAMVTIPIAPWSARMYRAEVKGMQYDIEAMKKGREAVLIEARGMLAGMASQIARMEQQLENYETKIIPALEKNYQTLMLAYEENREQLPMVIDGWEAMNMAQIEYLFALEEYYIMIAKYEKEIEK